MNAKDERLAIGWIYLGIFLLILNTCVFGYLRYSHHLGKGGGYLVSNFARPSVSYGVVNPESRSDDVEYTTLFFGANFASKYSRYNNASLLVYMNGGLRQVDAIVTFSVPSDYEPEKDKKLQQEFGGDLESMVATQVRTVLIGESMLPSKNGLVIKGRPKEDHLKKMLEILNAPKYGAGSERGPFDSFLSNQVKITGISILGVK